MCVSSLVLLTLTCVFVEMFGSCLVILTLATLYEGLKVLRERLMKRSVTVHATGKTVQVPTSEEAEVTTRSTSNHSTTLVFHCLAHLILCLMCVGCCHM